MLISYIIRCIWESRNSGKYGNSGKRSGCVATTPVEFRNSGNYGNYGKRCRCVATPPVEFGNSGNPGKRCYITGPSGIPEFLELCEIWEEMSYHWALWNSGIPGIMGILGRDVISLGPLEFRNSGNYGNSGKRCLITGPSGIPEFLE